MIDLDELERKEQEATPQDWIAHPPRVYIGLLEGRPAYVDFCNTPDMDANAQLCAALRNAAPELIAMARRTEAMHVASCQAVCPQIGRTPEGYEAHAILRQALIDYADAMEQKP
jgi:hypothetical protein